MLRAWSEGEREALESLLPLVYEELHRQAHRYLRRERRNNSLQTTAPRRVGRSIAALWSISVSLFHWPASKEIP